MFYPKIETLFIRDKYTFKVLPGKFRYEAFSLINEWEWTEKIDGTNIFVTYNNDGSISYGGRTSNSQLPKGVISYLDSVIDQQAFKDHFQEASVIIFGEGYGPKIQKGEGLSPTQKFIVFDIFINGYWLKRPDIEDICNQFGFDVVPLVFNGSLNEAVDMVKNGFVSKLGSRRVMAEGLIGRTKIPLFDHHGKRLITKLKTCDFEQKVEPFFKENL